MTTDNPSLTPWFPPEVKPVRDGVYEINDPEGGKLYRLFRKHRWYYGSTQIKIAAKVSEGDIIPLVVLKEDTLPWRGLTENPKP
jgi:hypothetical protein